MRKVLAVKMAGARDKSKCVSVGYGSEGLGGKGLRLYPTFGEMGWKQKTDLCFVGIPSDLDRVLGAFAFDRFCNEQQIEMLLRRGACGDWCDSNGESVYRAVLSRFSLTPTPITELIFEFSDVSNRDYQGRTPLHYCADNGLYDGVVRLLNCGADINEMDSSGSTPLHLAAFRGYRDIVSFLVDSGADVHLFDVKGRLPLGVARENYRHECEWVLSHTDVDFADHYNRTSLYFAALGKDYEMVAFFCEQEAKVDCRDIDGRTPFYCAVERSDRAMAAFLYEWGAELDVPDNDGWTPLYVAVLNGNVEMVEWLQDCGADGFRKNNEGVSPLELARQRKKTTICDILEKNLVERKA